MTARPINSTQPANICCSDLITSYTSYRTVTRTNRRPGFPRIYLRLPNLLALSPRLTKAGTLRTSFLVKTNCPAFLLMLTRPNPTARTATRRLTQLSKTLRSPANSSSNPLVSNSISHKPRAAMLGPHERRHKVTVVGSGNWYD